MVAFGSIIWHKAQLVRHQSQQREQEAHRRAANRLLVGDVPAWREQTLYCEGCSRALLVGERPLIVSRGEKLLLAYPLCQDRLPADGYTRVAAGPQIAAENSLADVTEQEQLAV